MIQPDMVPTEVGIAAVQVTKTNKDTGVQTPAQLVHVQIMQPTGVTHVFFEPDSAKEVGFNLMEAGKQGASGIQTVRTLEGLPRMNGQA